MEPMTHRAPSPQADVAAEWGSDTVAALLRALDIPYIALTPGASFRGLHDSLVNYLGNERPELLLCVHEEHAVALAHGYARVTGRPLAVALHTNVGVMHAGMAVFNAWCDRIPILMLAGEGPVDAVKRRPWVDWIHTTRDLGSLLRGYVKWDDAPASVAAALESIVRAYRIATTPPYGPTLVCLDAAMQEEPTPRGVSLPDLRAYAAPITGDPPDFAVVTIADALQRARKPLLLVGRVSNDAGDFERRIELAERVDARVLTDLKTGATFPTRHPAHPHPPGLYVSGDAATLILEADVIVSLDWIDLAGSLRQACAGKWPDARVFECSVDQYAHNRWNMDYQALPPTELSVLCAPDRAVRRLLDQLGTKPRSVRTAGEGSGPANPVAAETAEAPKHPAGCLSMVELARAVSESLAASRPSYIRLPIGWPGEYCAFAHPLDYIGFDGGGGIGSGPGMAVGAALALQGSGRLPVAVLGDGDYLMGVTALWTGVQRRLPLVIVVANNQSFFNDELHQERVARTRGRPVENRSIGLRMSDPPMDLAQLARGQGAEGWGPVQSVDALQKALAEALPRAAEGRTCVVDVRVAPEYARTVSSSLLRQIPAKA